eukprot:gnl/Chilomastix_cuspidata/9144.p5 GENE.gnl/Chilomastix_cuspidata/9144~~gnl/Chilomastix_cuspidata/9144.p5  ORF type:complete len:107 (+),score=27.10 gnl/Chilomastix_cuspidata/9144:891-1211(+)
MVRADRRSFGTFIYYLGSPVARGLCVLRQFRAGDTLSLSQQEPFPGDPSTAAHITEALEATLSILTAVHEKMLSFPPLGAPTGGGAFSKNTGSAGVPTSPPGPLDP